MGLSSAIVHSKFKKLPQGILSLVRRCQSEDCEGHCVCSPQDKVCRNNGSSCNDVTSGKLIENGHNNSNIFVFNL